MTQFVSHIPVDIAVSRNPRFHAPPPHLHYHHQHHFQPLPPQQQQKKTDGNASFLRAARSGNVEKVIEQLKGNIDINTSNANGLNALHLAAKEGHVNIVTELLKRGANVNAATKKGNTALHIGSLAGQEEVVRVLIQLGANVNIQSQNGFTPLYMAAQENHDNVVSFLLANGANQSLATEDGFTPLAVALQQGHDKVVAVLLENDTKGRVRLPALHIAAKKDDCKAATLLLQSDHNPDVTSKSGFTPLHIAAHYGNEDIARILLNKGADVNYGAKHQITPLHVASKWGKLLMVTLLLEKGADIEASTRDGLTPLHCAARSGHDQVVDLLLEKGAPFLAKTKNGLAPLHMASQGDHVDSARTLLYHKAPVDDVTVDYLTALHVAAHCGHVKVAKLLLDRKADPNARALNGFTPLHIACKKNRIKVVELLLKHGASIEATTESGLTPLHVASFMGCMNIVIYLIQNGANPDVPTVRGETPLHLAARANQTDIIRILLRNGASVDARAREEQTPLHIAARLGNVDIVSLLLQHGAVVDATTKDMYTTLHIAAKEDQEEVAASLMEHGASLTSTTKKGFTPLHLAAKYGNIKVARLLLQKGAPVDAQGKNGVTPLHVAAHYDHVNVALLLLDKGASPHAMAKNGYTPLHIAAKKNQMDIASTLLEYGAKTNSESKAGFTPLHLSAQEGHAEMSSLLIDHKANVNQKANNGLTPLHLCAQDDRVNVATILAQNGADIGPQTKAGYTPLHVASHFGQINMVRFLLQKEANVHTTTSHGYTALHQAAQQGHTLAVNLLLENQASPNVTTTQGQTPLSIAQRLGYISVVETLKVVTETTIITTTTTVTEEKYKVVAPETMQETFMTDSEDEGGADFDEVAIFGKPTHATHVYLPYVEGKHFHMSEEAMLGDQSYGYLTADEMKSLGDDSLPIDVTKDEKHHDLMHSVKQFGAPMVEEDKLSPQHATPVEFSEKFSPDNVDLSRVPVHAGRFSWTDDYYRPYPLKGMLRSRFLVSFMVDARGGAMRGCRHSGVRVIIPPRKAPMPMRITCRFLRKEKLVHPPPLMEGEACASRILEMGPVAARFLGPVIIEVPHFASTRGKEREITILRSDTGESWREHTLEASEEAVQEVLNESFEGEELSALEDLNTNRITRILTTDFPQYFAIVSRIRQEVHAVGPEGGMVSSTVVPQVQAIFPEGALTKKIRVGLQAQPIAPELVAKLLGNRVAVSPIVTVEPRRRKFHKPITLTIPVPQATTKGMINQYSGDAPTLRLLCSITGGTSKAQWEDVTGSTPLTFVNDCVSFTTTVSARFWLMDCRQVNEVSRFATELYQEAVYVPFMSKFVIFAKRYDPYEAQLRVFCMTDDKEDKTLESQENFTEVAKSRDVEVLEGKLQYLEFAGNLAPVTKSGDQLKLTFAAFHENRLPFAIRVKDPHIEPMGRIAFMKEPKAGRGEPPQVPICNLNIALPEVTFMDSSDIVELVTLEKRYDFIQEAGLSKPELIHRADLRLSDIATALDKDWVPLAQQLDVAESDISQIKTEPSCDQPQQALMMLRLWLQKSGSKATGNELEKGLRRINREDVINNCMFNVELVTDDVEKAVAKVHLDQSGFDVFKEELGSSREASIRRGASLDISYDEQDIMKEAESAADTSSETGSLFEKDRISQALTDDKDARLRRASKTPPPTPVDEEDKELKNVTKVKNIIITSSFQGKVVDNIKEAFEEDKSQELAGPHGLAARLTESETWPSLEMDTSQVSISSLPYDEKSEPTTASASDSANAPSLETDKIISQGIDKVGADCQVLTSCITETTTHFTSVPSTCLADSVNESYIAETDVTQDQVKRSSYDAQNVEHDGVSKDDGQQPIGERAHAQKTCIADERHAQTSSKTESLFEFQTIIDESQPDAGCAFVNTAFAGAEAIDEVEHSAPIRARSPYEVVRDDITDPSVDEPKELPTTSAKSTYVMSKQIEMRHRPMLKHIPSEISEEDLVEREMSPVAKLEFEQLLKSGPTTRELLKAEMERLTEDRTISSDVFQTTTTTSTCTSKTVVTSLKSEDSSTLHMSTISQDDEGTTQTDSRVESLVTSIEKETSKDEVNSSMNGPGEVEYQPEYDYNEETSENRISETSSLVRSSLEQLQSDGDEKKRHYSSISDDVIDLEIGEILRSEQQFEDIIDRPVSPEPPKDEYTGILRDSVDGTKESFVETHSSFFVNEGRPNSSPPPYPGDLPRGFSHDLNFEKEIIETSDEAMDMDSDPYSDEKEAVFSYDMRFERDQEDLPCYGDLYTHQEEDEDALEGGDRSKITFKSRKEPEFDILAGRKYFSRNLESDEASVSSLQEFEHLEEIVCERKSSVGSIDSQNGKPLSKSGEHDDVSMSSLTEFERIEQECLEDKIDPAMQESRLSEIDEGHESQASEPSHDKSDNCKDEDLSIVEEYDHHLEDIDRIILKPDCSDDHQLPFQYFVKPEAQTDMSSGISSKVTKLISTITSGKIGGTEVCKTYEGYFESHSRDDDMDQDSLHDELSLKPDSLAEDAKGEFLDSLHEERCVDVDSLQDDIPEGMRDSLLEDRQIEDDSLHEMDILPDESSLSMESSFAALMPDSSKADNEAKTQTQQDTFAFTSLENALIHASKQTKTEVVISDLAPSDIMLSSTDSLEQSSSAAAAFHLESESAMSTSLTGVPFSEDNTMISSTDTLEHEGRITFRYEDIPVDELEILVKDGRKVIVDSEGNIQTDYEYKHFLEAEDNINNGISHTSKDFIETRIPTTLFQCPTSTTTDSFGCVAIPDESGDNFNATLNGKNEKQFHTSDPEVEIEEIHTTDEFGNPKVVRRMKKVIHTKKEQFSSSSSSENVEEKLKEFLREHGAGESAGKSEEVVQEERSIDDKGDVVLVRTVKQQMLSHPEVHSRTFTGSSAASLSKEYIEQFKTLEPMDEMCEFEKVDDEGNVVRVTQQVVIKPEVHSISFSGPNAHQQMEDYMKQFASASQNGGSKGQSKTFSSVQISTSEQGYIPSDSTSQDTTSISHFIKTTTSSIDPEPVIVRTTTSTTVSSSTDSEKKAEESSDQTSSAV